MSNAGEMAEITVDGGRASQTIDGFGVNINAKYWNDGRLIPTLDLLREDLGATLYRVDIWGKSNWIDPDSTIGPGALNREHLASIYQGDVFRRGWALMRYLNEHGIEPYLTVSGDVPRWMLGTDGRSLSEYEPFCDMLVSMVEWAVRKEGLCFTLFGPLNETDVGSPEGPSVNPAEFVKVLEVLHDRLARRGLDDIRLVVAEQGSFKTDYLREIVSSDKLVGRIGVFGMHTYFPLSPDAVHAVQELVKNSRCASCGLWLTEYGDLEQSGEREWYVAWAMTSRLFDALEGGFNGALVWDAFDNYHDHDEAWTIYGLLRTGRHVYTPKKRYYATRQVHRFVLPGFERVEVTCALPNLRLLAFADPQRTQLTLVGMSGPGKAYHLNVRVKSFSDQVKAGRVFYYRTSETENCHRIGVIPVTGPELPFTGIDAFVPPDSIFTLTTVNDSPHTN
jgi:O-glycosyl hydrolase